MTHDNENRDMAEQADSSLRLVCSILIWLLLGLIVSHAVLLCLGPLSDWDFWWHLKTGEQIVTNKALLATDPFAYPRPMINTDPGRERFLLTSYWLADSLIYLCNSTAGIKGLVALRIAMLALMLGGLFQRMRSLRLDPLLSLTVTAASLTLFGNLYTLDRPQVWSFIGATLLVGMMEKIRNGGKPSYWLLPLMTLWANLHGGFIVGDLLLSLFAAGSVIEYRREPRKLGGIILWATGGILASLINPNGYYAFLFTLTTANSSATNSFVIEFMSSYAAFKNGYSFIPILWAMILLTPVGMALSRRLYWPDLFLWVFVSYISFSYMRNAAFFAIALAPLCVYYLDSGFCLAFPRERMQLLSRTAVAGVVLVVMGFAQAMFLNFSPVSLAAKSFFLGFPEQSANFIESSGIQGRMFNEYSWGGYLIWRLHPRQVFIDGRVVHAEIFDDYITMFKGKIEKIDGGQPAYMVLLDRYQIDYIVQPLMLWGGEMQPLMKYLLNEKGWTPVYLDDISFIIVRNDPKNSAVVKQYEIPRLTFINRLLAILQGKAAKSPGIYRNHLALGDLFIYLGRFREAEQALLQAQRLAPANVDISRNLNYIRTGKYLP